MLGKIAEQEGIDLADRAIEIDLDARGAGERQRRGRLRHRRLDGDQRRGGDGQPSQDGPKTVACHGCKRYHRRRRGV
jgi:hypothetical protein